MEPTIAAAWIAAGSAAVGAVVGVSGAVVGAMFSRRASRDATAQTIKADQDSRDLEKKSAAYTDALAGILHRMRVRDCQQQRMMTHTEPEQPSAPVDWPLVEARLFAYASDDVLNALDQANKADSEWDAVFHKWITDYEKTQDAQQTGNPPEAVEKAFPNAENMDHTLMVTIRTELQHRPHPAQHAHKLRHRDGTRRAH